MMSLLSTLSTLIRYVATEPDMSAFVKIGRDIIVGKGFAAKHWSGAVIFGREAIYICPNATQTAVMQGLDSGAMAAAGILGGALGGLIAGAVAGATKKNLASQANWKRQVIDLCDLPTEVRENPDWPLRERKRPVILLTRESVDKIERRGG